MRTLDEDITKLYEKAGDPITLDAKTYPVIMRRAREILERNRSLFLEPFTMKQYEEYLKPINVRFTTK